MIPACKMSGRPASAKSSATPKYRGLLGAESKKIRRDGDKTYILASGDPESADAEWYDFSGAPIDPAQLQFGIGKDRIQAIDDPVYVTPDDPQLMSLPESPYRKDERPKTNDEIMVSGYVVGDVARAFPVGLLDRHELVNDTIGGRPVTVGW